jgi:zinc transport system substrate-binding protein
MFLSVRFVSQMCMFCAFWCVGAIASASVSVLPSTQALSLAVIEVTGEVYPPLLPANVSPHDFSLRPSHIRRLQEAELVVWLGPELEPYLAKVMAQVPGHKQLIINQGLLSSDYGQHPWTSPEYLLQGMRQLSLHLGKAWNSGSWLKTISELQQQLLVHTVELNQNNQGYVVYHDGLGGFEAYFGLKHLASFTGADDQPPGAKRLAAIAQLAKEGKVACILIDHEVKPKLVDAVLDANVERISIDILAANSHTLIGYITELQRALLSCGPHK